MGRKERHEHAGHSSASDMDIPAILRISGVKAGDVLLDLGCGKGDYSLVAARMVGPEGRVYSLDAHGESLNELADMVYSDGIQNMMMIRSDMTKGVPLSDSEADVVLLFNVLHGLVWNGEEDMPLKEIARILKKGGTLSVMEPIPGSDGHGPPNEVRLSTKEIEEVLSRYGFRMRASDTFADRRLVVFGNE